MTDALNSMELLAALAKAIEQSLGSQLVSLTLYGSIARGTAEMATNDVNLLMVLASHDVELLEKSRRAIAGTPELHVSPYIIHESELPQLADLFATRLLEMKRGYRVLAGRDVLADLAINTQTLKIRVAQELLNIVIRLRGELLRAETPDSLEQDLEAFLQPFLKTLRSLIFVRTGEHIESRRELIEKSASLFNLDREALLQLSAWRSGRVSFTDGQWLTAATSLLKNAETVLDKSNA